MGKKTWTRDEVGKAMNAGADLVLDDFDSGDRDRDFANAIVNAAMGVLDNPEVTMTEVIKESYSDPPDEVRSWWTNWA